jgi:hypothetical protein
LYYSATAAAAPTAGNLVAGELAINTNDGKLYYKDSGGVVQTIASKATGTVAGSTAQVIYNNAGAYAGSANLTFNGTTLTTANDASISGLTVGKGGGSVASNTALGVSALGSNTSGSINIAIGNGVVGTYYAPLASNTTGSNNIAIGTGALGLNSSGSYNIATGYQALFNNSTGTNNSAYGWNALGNNTTGGSNTAIGYQALLSNTTASNNTAVGYQAFYASTAANNVGLGARAGYGTTTGENNVSVGSFSLLSNTTGGYNVAMGTNALNAATTANFNVSVGYFSSAVNTTGTQNTAIGTYALQSNTTATQNIALGYQAGNAVTTGSVNTFLGWTAGNNITTGTFNTYIGYTAASASNVSYELTIGNGGSATTGKGGNTGFINPNGGGVYQGNNSAAWSITSDARLKKNIVDNTTGLFAISQIQVRNFEYRTSNEVTDLPKEQAIDVKGVQLGAIAQELQVILPDCVKTESTGVMSVDSTNLTWYLINAVKELNAKVTALETKLGA